MKPITIIGGGLAGLTAGILLRRAEVPVTIIEAGRYPRHRVCGEFLSGHGCAILRELDLEKSFFDHGAVEAHGAMLHVEGRAPVEVQLPEPALCLSRFAMDHLLAEEFCRMRGQLQVAQRWTGDLVEGMIGATGRRRADVRQGRLFGLKAHAWARLDSDLEMHFGERRYVGVCRLSAERVNVCGLFYAAKAAPEIQSSWKSILAKGIPVLENVRWDEESFCSVAGLTLDRFHEPSRFEIGDAAAMIPPLTGNGMSMAFESAHLAVPPLIDYANGKTDWPDAQRQYAQEWEKRFAGRLRWASLAQRLAFNGPAQKAFLGAANHLPLLLKFFIGRTR